MLKINELYFRLVKVSINNILGVRDNITISIRDVYRLLSHGSILSLSENEPDIKKLMILLVEFGNGANLLI
jgi:hypothetical protein